MTECSPISPVPDLLKPEEMRGQVGSKTSLQMLGSNVWVVKGEFGAWSEGWVGKVKLNATSEPQHQIKSHRQSFRFIRKG